MPESLEGVYEPRGCVANDCPMYGACGLEDQLILAIRLNVLQYEAYARPYGSKATPFTWL